MLKKIDGSFYSWMLGLSYGSNLSTTNQVKIRMYYSDSDAISKIARCLKEEYFTINKDTIYVDMDIINKELSNGLYEYMESIKNISDIVNYCSNNSLVYDFIRGIFECRGNIYSNKIVVRTDSEEFSKSLVDFMEIPPQYINGSEICYVGCNALDFLGKIYYDGVYFKTENKFEKFVRMCTYKITDKSDIKDFKIYVCKTREDAVIPSKSRISDSGYDLTLLSLDKKIGEVELYDTGIKVVPPFGYYFDVVPRSSIIKSGYMLANSVGIIDRTYLGSIKIPLIKIDKNAKDLECPMRLVQLIPRQIQHFEIVESNDDSIGTTNRGSDGFGSTGK